MGFPPGDSFSRGRLGRGVQGGNQGGGGAARPLPTPLAAGRAGVIDQKEIERSGCRAPRTRRIGASLVVRGASSLIESRQPRRQRVWPRNAATGARRRSAAAEEKQLSFLEPDADVDAPARRSPPPFTGRRRDCLQSNRIEREHIAAIAMPAVTPPLLTEILNPDARVSEDRNRGSRFRSEGTLPYGKHLNTRPKGTRLAASSLHDNASRVTAAPPRRLRPGVLFIQMPLGPHLELFPALRPKESEV